MKSEPRVEKSFQFVLETTKQIIALSTFIIGITITFFENLCEQGNNIKHIFPYTWLLFLLSIFCGLCVLLNLSGTLGNVKEIPSGNVSIYRKNIRLCMFAQLISFFVALALAVYTFF